jgi:hypothetical protein
MFLEFLAVFGRRDLSGGLVGGARVFSEVSNSTEEGRAFFDTLYIFDERIHSRSDWSKSEPNPSRQIREIDVLKLPTKRTPS